MQFTTAVGAGNNQFYHSPQTGMPLQLHTSFIFIYLLIFIKETGWSSWCWYYHEYTFKECTDCPCCLCQPVRLKWVYLRLS